MDTDWNYKPAEKQPVAAGNTMVAIIEGGFATRLFVQTTPARDSASNDEGLVASNHVSKAATP